MPFMTEKWIATQMNPDGSLATWPIEFGIRLAFSEAYGQVKERAEKGGAQIIGLVAG